MKKTIGILMLIIFFGITGLVAQTEQKRTEEYAIVDVIELRKRKIIRVTIGEEPAVEKEWKDEKTDVKGDFHPVMVELGKLNAQGFNLLNMSTAYHTQGSSTVIYGFPIYTFMLVKKLK